MDAFSRSILHAIAATFRAQLPSFEGVGPGEWSVPQEVILIIYKRWLWIGVCYKWALIFIAIIIRVWVLRIVGVGKSGSALSVASITAANPEGPLKLLIEDGHMHRKDNFNMI